MFVSNRDDEIRWYWIDGKMHTIKIDNKGKNIDLKKLSKSTREVIENKEDLCKSIFYLGLSLTGSEGGASGFLLGWLIRSIKSDLEWNIIHDEEEVDKEEVREHLASTFEKMAGMIREGESDPTGSTPNMGGSDGTEMFK